MGIVAEIRHQEAARPLGGRVGVREIGEVEHRNAVHLEHGVLVFDALVLEVLHRGIGAQLPERRFGRVALAEVAG